MNLKNKKQAYTLAEIMLVILVLSIIFAAMAPIFTKRKITQFTGKYNVWSYADRVNFNAFYDPGDPGFTGELFFGITPSDGRAVASEFAPLSKLVIRAGEVTSANKQQRHIQFRFGRTESDKDGVFAGSWFVNRKNVFLGGSYDALSSNESTGARDNVAIGYEALDKITTGKNNVAIGYKALNALTGRENNVVIGHRAGTSSSVGDKNVFVGYSAGAFAGTHTTVSIGYQAGMMGTAANTHNVFIGAFSGGGLSAQTPGTGNTAIGYRALGKVSGGSENIAIGYNALGNLSSGSHNIAIGYNACSELTTQSKKTCIGYNSGPKAKNQTKLYGTGTTFRQANGNNYSNNGSAFLLFSGDGKNVGSAIADDVERVYIGGTPRNYAGDAVLEIHNPSGTNIDLGIGSDSSVNGDATTIINGNLIVRGRPYFTVGSRLYHFQNDYATMKTSDTSQILFGYNNLGTSICANFENNANKPQSVDYKWHDRNNRCPNMNTTVTSGSSGGGSSGGGNNGSSGNQNQDDFEQCDGYCMDYREAEERCRETGDTFDCKDANDLYSHLNSRCPGFACSASDRRLKNIGERFTGGLKELKKLNVYNFTFKNDETKRLQVGVLAQELQKVFPTAVFQDENGYLKIRWDEMFFSTINAIKELDKKIVTLVKRTTKVETQISKLEQENVELKAQVESLTARVNKLKAQ